MNNTAGGCVLEYGLGIWVRNVNKWSLRNLWSDGETDLETIEVQRPIPHPLYMGDFPAPEGHEAEKKYSAGRDEEDRPVLWSRIDNAGCDLKIYFLSLHLPTLKGEEGGNEITSLNQTQEDIARITLSLSEQELQTSLENRQEYDANSNIVDVLASALRVRYLEQLGAQCKRIKRYWGERRCVFILAGDFNFRHSFQQSNDNRRVETPEEESLRDMGFSPTKTSGSTRPGGRLVDNIWVNGPVVEATEHTIEGVQIESAYKGRLCKISDHFPAVADIEL